ncbi:hypothetical protein [Pararhizobium sp.]|uniref:hypothetical protein n=1 Tax=Pararhizobium sp. TaxID=1977563 RepID=UPI003D0EE820
MTIVESERVLVEVSEEDTAARFVALGFEKSENYDAVYGLRSQNPDVIYRLCESLRDLGIPYSTHRHMGADYQLQLLREQGHVHGPFKRINFFGNDWNDEAPFVLEDF